MLELESSFWLVLWAEPGFPACNKLEPIVTENEVEAVKDLPPFDYDCEIANRVSCGILQCLCTICYQRLLRCRSVLGPSCAERLLFFDIVQVIHLIYIPFLIFLASSL